MLSTSLSLSEYILVKSVRRAGLHPEIIVKVLLPIIKEKTEEKEKEKTEEK